MNPFSLYLLIILLFLFSLFVIRLIYRKFRERAILKRIASSGIRYIDRMDGHQFEFFLKALFKVLGYKPKLTGKSHDFGADLILEGRNRIVIQAKRYGFKKKVGLSAVQEVYAAQAFYKAHEAWVITNSHFTRGAKELANACHVKLLPRVELQKFINQVNPDVTAKEVYNEVEPAPRTCPDCGSPLVVRTSKTGNKFFGCTRYPNCDHTERINI